MAAIENTTTTAQIDASIREIDFVSRFQRNWDLLLQIMGISRPIRKAPGTKLVGSTATVTLESGAVDEGDIVPFSLAEVNPVEYADLTLEKYAKATTAEAILKYGYAVAIEKTDAAFLNALTKNIQDRFYSYLNEATGVLEPEADPATFQAGLAKAKGLVVEKFQELGLDATEVVAFVNTMDVYDYLGTAEISIQSQFGFQYIKNFMGFRTVFLCPDSAIAAGTIFAIPVDNLVLYYVDPSDSEFGRAGLEYRTVGEGSPNLIGVHVEGNYSRVQSEISAILGMALWAEYVNGIAKVEFGE